MSAISRAVGVCNDLTGKTLTPAEIISIVTRYNKSFPEYDDPGNNEGRANFFLQAMRTQARLRIASVGKSEYDSTTTISRIERHKLAVKAGEDAADEL